jgi:hypothetical protein
MRQRRDAALRSLKLMLVASVALPFLLFCYAAWADYHVAFALADERIERADDIAAEQALRVFQSITVTFDSVEQITRGRTDQTIKLNAAELGERLKRRPGLKVLYMTGYSRNAIVHQGRLDAGVSLMQKPFSQNVLAMRVRTMLEEA